MDDGRRELIPVPVVRTTLLFRRVKGGTMLDGRDVNPVGRMLVLLPRLIVESGVNVIGVKMLALVLDVLLMTGEIVSDTELEVVGKLDKLVFEVGKLELREEVDNKNLELREAVDDELELARELVDEVEFNGAVVDEVEIWKLEVTEAVTVAGGTVAWPKSALLEIGDLAGAPT